MIEEIAKIIEPKGMMAQYKNLKEQHPDCVLFFRLGDFYEMFCEDAIEMSKLLDLTLTQRGGNVMCGVPAHSAQTYVAKIVATGRKVAICEQAELKPGEKGMMKRYVSRVVTAGTVTEEEMLESAKNNFIVCLAKVGENLGVSYSDITTGLFEVEYVKENLLNSLTDILTRVGPSEVIVNQEAKNLYDSLPIQKQGFLPRAEIYYDWAFRFERADENLQKQFGENYKKVYELDGKREAILSAYFI